MRWVTYLSPSGGGERAGALDDGDVLGSPDHRGLAELMAAGPQELARAHSRAVDTPIEIIVELEARMAAPVRPTALVPVRAGERLWEIPPELVTGVDDPVLRTARAAHAGVAAVAGAEDGAAAFTPACLWTDDDGLPVQLSLGPVLTTADELAGAPVEVGVFVADDEVARTTVGTGEEWLVSGPGRVRALLPLSTPPLAEDDELYVELGPLGEFEVRVGAQA
ncbi:hypothetical protein IDM40_01775 [Nocardiopsis sp. HNM0947]|uniref:2-keto-4-pentenoate hydratase n=1 Tax=Nocardiopsis coralli TaxID=2772213 RepID=A0ABR9P0U4_9ACTN|nr:hypothetical protein [Nocardiopsis coralli]MBE2997437.1 hypothetical protein [Nocardiopsis coralli]